MIQNITFWKRQQNKNSRRRLTVRGRNLHALKMSRFGRMKGAGGKVSRLVPSNEKMTMNMFHALLALMNSRRVMKQQGKRGA